MAKRGRYLIGQKISDARIERILLAYAENQTAAEFIRHARATMRKPPAEKTVYQIYRLVRRRLYEIGFHHGEFWLDVADAPDEGSNFVKRMYLHFDGERRIPAEIARRRGMTKANRDQIIGEAISVVCYPHATPKAYLAMIHKVIKVCGRLNEPVRNLHIWRLHETIGAQTRWMSEVRSIAAKHSQGSFDIESMVRPDLLAAERELRREKRKMAKERGRLRAPQSAIEISRERILRSIQTRAVEGRQETDRYTREEPYPVKDISLWRLRTYWPEYPDE